MFRYLGDRVVVGGSWRGEGSITLLCQVHAAHSQA